MRLIDADEFKNYIRGALDDVKHLYKDNGAWAKEITDSFCMDIDEQPTVEAEPRWTPCSERLPETYGAYLVQDVCGNIFVDYWRGYWLAKTTMVAWMPLPEPYRGGDEDERNRIIEIGFAHFDDLLDGMEAEL